MLKICIYMCKNFSENKKYSIGWSPPVCDGYHKHIYYICIYIVCDGLYFLAGTLIYNLYFT